VFDTAAAAFEVRRDPGVSPLGVLACAHSPLVFGPNHIPTLRPCVK